MSPPKPSSKQSLTFHQKQLIIDEFKKRKSAGSSATKAALASWAKETLSLTYVPNQSTISRIFRDSEKLKSMPISQNLNMKKARTAVAPRLEDALYRWMCTQNNNGILLNGDIIKMYGKQLLEKTNEVLPESEKIQLTFSKGWIERFKRRYGLRFRRVHGEAASADTVAIEQHMPRIERIIMTFQARDTWNADEFGLFYRQPPGWTLSNGVVSGQKKDKTRITFLACCNGDGSEKMKLMVVGRAAVPRAFNKKSGHELGFDYHSNKKAWMTTPLFFGWLVRFDNFIGQTEGRKVLLLIDNCSAHGKDGTLPPLRHVRVEFLPPNATSKVQPLDAGIIAWVKGKYKRRLLFRVFDNIDMGSKSIYNVDILCAMRWTQEEWESCPANVIKNCFDHCLKQDVEKSEEERGSAVRSTLDSMERDATEHGARFTRTGLENLLNPEEENNVTEEPTLEDLAREVAGMDADSAAESDTELQEEGDVMSVQQELHVLAQARSILEKNGGLCEEGRKAFYKCQRSLRLEKVASMRQTSILDHFKQK